MKKLFIFKNYKGFFIGYFVQHKSFSSDPLCLLPIWKFV